MSQREALPDSFLVRLGNPAIPAILVVCASLCFTGCNSQEATQLAGGTVSVDGQPVKQGKVTFYPAGGGRVGSGVIQPDGSYLLSYRKPGDGVPVGDYKVAIIADKFDPAVSASAAADEGAELDVTITDGKLTHIVPPKYNTPESTPLTVSVVDASETQRFDFDIPSKD